MVGLQAGPIQRATVAERVVGLLQGFDLVAEALVELRLAGGLVESLLDGLEIGECEFDLDHAEMIERIGSDP